MLIRKSVYEEIKCVFPDNPNHKERRHWHEYGMLMVTTIPQ